MANTKITSRVLADNAVLTANITDANVTTAKVADNAVTGDKVADDVALAGNPTTTTQSAGNNTTRIATTAFVSTAVANLADSAPDALNTLNELAAAMGDDANFSTTITNSIAAKLPLAGGTMTGDLILGDNVKVEIGSASGGDLQLYHDGSNSYIHDAGTGQLRVSTSEFKVLNAAQGEAMIAAVENGAVTLYYDNAAKLATASGGVTVTGTISSSDISITSAGASISLIDSDNNPDYQIKNGNGAFRIIDTTNSVDRINIDSSGNVGIGTASPSTALHILGSSTSRNTIVSNVTIDGGTAVGYPYAGYGFGIDFKGKDYGNTAIREYGRIIAHMTNQTSQTEAGDAGFKSALSFYTNTGGASSTAATEKMTILSDGNVGIGTTSPAVKGEIKNAASGAVATSGTTQTNGVLRLSSSATTGIIDFGMNGSNPFIQATDSTGLNNFYNLNLNPAGGKVGIGTTSPNDELDIAAVHSQLRLTDTDDSKFVQFSYSGGKLVTRNNDASTTVNQFTLTEDGKFGIGTISPDTLLHINNLPDNKFMTFEQSGRKHAIGTYFSSNANDSRLEFYMSDGNTNGSNNNRLTIKGNGNVGIGTTSPAKPLSVHGNVEFRTTDTDGNEERINWNVGGASDAPSQTMYGADGATAKVLFHAGGASYFTGGNLGVGDNSPAYRLELPNTASSAGQVRANAYQTYSDSRIKSNIQTLSYGLDIVKQLKPSQYKHHNSIKEDGQFVKQDEGANDIGFIAQEVLPLIPEVVSVPVDTDKDLYSISYPKLTAVLTKAIQELTTKLEAAEARIKTLEES